MDRPLDALRAAFGIVPLRPEVELGWVEAPSGAGAQRLPSLPRPG